MWKIKMTHKAVPSGSFSWDLITQINKRTLFTIIYGISMRFFYKRMEERIKFITLTC